MKVNLIETGGWTNIRSGCSIDTTALPEPVADALVRAVSTMLLFVDHAEPTLVRDGRTVCIEVECGDKWKRASFSEAAPPAEARPVLEILRPYCRPMPLRA